MSALALAGCLAPAAGVAAQSPQADQFFRRERFLEEEIRQRLDADIPAKQAAILTYGGYIIPQWQQYDDVRRQSNFRQIDLRLWGQLVVDDVHRIYARMRMAHTNFGPGDSPFGWNQDLEGPNLDQGFYELSLSRAIEKRRGERLPADVRMTVGRQFVEFGQGVALSQVLDGGTVVAETGQWRVTGLFGQTIESRSNIDHSPSVADHMDRTFGGLQIQCLAFSDHQPFAYFVKQHDQTHERPTDFVQDYDYDSSYFGFGSTGEVLRNLRYASEVVFETGTSQRQGGPGADRIRAFAFDQLFEYFFRGKHDPVLSAEYAVATGDDDRDSASSTIAGNRAGQDNAFLGFGYLNTGYAFAPEFTNLQFVRLGGRLKPLPDHKVFERLEVGSDWFWFAKQKRGGPMSDFRASDRDRHLGSEVDVYANWRVFSDLSVMVRYGRFWTGDAFALGEKRDYVYAGLVFSF